MRSGIGRTIALAGTSKSLLANAETNMNSDESKAFAKITPGKNAESDRQTIYFELPALPGQVFRLVTPELISDTEGNPMPWGHASPQAWTVEENHASFTDGVKDVVRTQVNITFQAERIEARVKVTNLTDRVWKNSNAFTCFLLKRAPLFSDPALERTFAPVEGKWTSLTEILRGDKSAHGSLTFFEVSGGPPLNELWVLKEIKNRYSEKLDHGSICVVSTDGKWVAGMTAPRAAYVFNNAGLPCIHADPLLGDVAPSKSREASSIIHIFKGSVNDFAERCRMEREKDQRTGVDT